MGVNVTTIDRMEKKKDSNGGRSKDRHGKNYRSVRFPLSIYAQMEEIATAQDRPTSWEFRRAIEEYIERKKKGHK